MSRFLVKKTNEIKVQQGNSCTIVLRVPVDVSLIGKTVKFFVENFCDGPNPSLEFSTLNSKLSVSSQDCTITLVPDDTIYKVGDYPWYMDVIGPNPTDIVTVGKGMFRVIDKRIS